MTTKKLLILGVIGLGILVPLELFYFRFHTYFQSKQVSEDIPINTGADDTSAPEVLAQGQFGEIDIVHKGTGTAQIIEQNGKYFLRFEDDFLVTNGPDLYVYLSNESEPNHSLESLGAYVDLGTLKGNMGSQNYEIPEEAREYRTAVVWCKKFSVLFTYAQLQ